MTTFSDLGLQDDVLKALTDLGFTTPTPIQLKAIPHLLSSKQDLKAFAQTGTGKTAAFSLPIINQVDIKLTKTQAIILSPTRELAIQIANNINEFTKYLPNLKTVAVYGGANIDLQVRGLRKGAQIVVGTPGRTVDLIKRRVLNLETIKWVVLDEADEMLNMGFKDELDRILEATPSDKQTLLFSATFPKEVDAIARNYMNNSFEISAGNKNISTVNVKHHAYIVEEKNRYSALKRITDFNPDIYGIVFCRTREETKTVAEKLIADGYSADALHGDLSQQQRDMVMQKFRTKHLQLLIATDVAARGLDVTDLTHVINYKIPDQYEAYTHRSGRTGRAGKEGISIVIVNGRERSKLKSIERLISKTFEVKTIPSSKDICGNQLINLINKVKDVDVNESEIESFLPNIYSELEYLSREELIKRFVSVEFNRFLSYYENAKDINGDASKSVKRKDDDSYSRYYINIGQLDDLNPGSLIGIINKNLKQSNFGIGQIEILKSFSFFEIEKSISDSDVVEALNNKDFNNRKISVELTTKPKQNSTRDRGDRRSKFKGSKPDKSSGFKHDRSSGFNKRKSSSSRR
ncbi:MAG: DEAD/DEAH box helicase [Flavobacteriales bacterium]|jgi:ATP-dependent RNA helicase DeaD|nr:DEAD/DEAH box helicase [Flavobacteriales bacterium]